MNNFNEIQPRTPSERIILLDFIRGIALFGILMVNIPMMNSPFITQISDYKLWDDSLNITLQWLLKFFFEGNFYVLFSLLFGIGFYLFLQKSDMENKKVVSVYRRRLLILLLFGILHIVFLWYGDILLGYALLGFAMVFLRKLSNKILIILSAIFLSIPILANGLMVLSIELLMKVPEIAGEITSSMDVQQQEYAELLNKAITVYSSGSFGEIISMRLLEYLYILPAIIFFYPNVMAMFLLGIVFGKNSYLFKPELHKEFFKKLLLWCFPFAIVGKFIVAHFSLEATMVMPKIEAVYIMVGYSIGGVAFALSIISVIILLYNTNFIQSAAKYIAPVGRMALTNYLSQSIICTTIFFSYGLGLYTKVNIWQGAIIVVAVYIIQVIWSNYWLKYFKYGPLEWLWRKGTYLKL